MSDLTRRSFLRAAAAISGVAVAVAGGLPEAVEAAPRRPPRRHGDLRDIQHVVVVMQENRSFDHYFGAMKGVRGFGDRSTILLPGGTTVWQQPQAPTVGAPTQYPWRLSGTAQYDGAVPPTPELGAANYGGTSHGWEDQHGAWYGGLMNGWFQAKGGPTTLGYLDRHDLPFHYALADAYTIGDAYHCSVLSATGPNRTYLWSGSINADQKYGDVVAYSGGDELGRFLPWEAYGETLQRAGVSWHVYQCEDDYGDNGMEYFELFAKLDPTQGGTAEPGNVYYDNGVANVPEPIDGLAGNADNINAAIRADVLDGTLPQVSWVVNNQFFSEHPVTAPSNGAYFLRGLLEALNADPDVFNSTVVIVNYDENDGQFDHVPPPIPAPGEVDEFVTGTLGDHGVTAPVPVGLGFRVPLILVSPWTRGGWVTSEVSDHTSVLQFLERWTAALRTPAVCPQISPWRRQVCGDLTSAFDFANPVYGLPALPDTGELIPETEYDPLPGDNTMPTQEAGTKPARPLPFQPNANLRGFHTDRSGALTARLALSNVAHFATRASHFAVYDNRGGVPALADYPAAFPGQYTVPAGDTMEALAPVRVTGGDSAYDITVVGPNRFLRRYIGDARGAGARATVDVAYRHGGHSDQPVLAVSISVRGWTPMTFTITSDHYAPCPATTVRVRPGRSETWLLDAISSSNGWYDVTITTASDHAWSQRLVGHLETGRPSVTG